MTSAHTTFATFSALIWWVVPAVALMGAMGYVVWVSKFQVKFDNETNRSVSKFQNFQQSFQGGSVVIAPNAQPAEVSEPEAVTNWHTPEPLISAEPIVIRPDSDANSQGL